MEQLRFHAPTRRRFLITTASLAALGLLAACGGRGPSAKSQAESAPAQGSPATKAAEPRAGNKQGSEIPPTAFEVLTSEVNQLPPVADSIKDGIDRRVLSILALSTPFSLNLGRVDINIVRNVISETADYPGTGVGGQAGLRRLEILNTYQPVNDTPVRFPLIGILKPGDIPKVASSNLLPYNTLIGNMTLFKGGRYAEGFSPGISISINPNIPAELKSHQQAARKFAYIAYAAGLYFELSRLDLVARFMSQNGLPTHIDARDNQGNLKKVEIISEISQQITAYRGRWSGIGEASGPILATRALVGTDSFKLLQQTAKPFSDEKFMAAVLGVNLGKSDDEMVANLSQAVLNDTRFKQLSLLSDLEKIGLELNFRKLALV
jgi:hypothetical protein